MSRFILPCLAINPTLYHAQSLLSHLLSLPSLFVTLNALHACYTHSLPSPSHLFHPQLAIVIAFFVFLAPTTCHCLHTSCTTNLSSHYNYINYNGQVMIKFKNRDKIGISNSQHCNWRQEETDTMDKNNSRDSVRGKSRGKGCKGPSSPQHKLGS